MANKRERQTTIRELVESRPVESQEDLRKLLRQRGWDVTQSTLSRDLRELRIARVPMPEGGARYALAAHTSDEALPALEALLPQFFTQIEGVGELIVMHTLPSGAQPVSEAIDAEEWPDILGTIAGEDTILIVCRSAAAREKVTRRLEALAAR